MVILNHQQIWKQTLIRLKNLYWAYIKLHNSHSQFIIHKTWFISVFVKNIFSLRLKTFERITPKYVV